MESTVVRNIWQLNGKLLYCLRGHMAIEWIVTLLWLGIMTIVCKVLSWGTYDHWVYRFFYCRSEFMTIEWKVTILSWGKHKTIEWEVYYCRGEHMTQIRLSICSDIYMYIHTNTHSCLQKVGSRRPGHGPYICIGYQHPMKRKLRKATVPSLLRILLRTWQSTPAPVGCP